MSLRMTETLTETICGRRVKLFTSKRNDAPLVVLNTVQDEGRAVWGMVRSITDMEFSLLAVSDIEWNDEMSPWPSETVVNGNMFGGKADMYLGMLIEEIIPWSVRKMGCAPDYMMIAGYSMAGLFSLYSLFRTNIFRRAVCASGSLWYPGFLDFVRNNEPKVRPDVLCMSLGDKESKNRNPVLMDVGEDTEEIYGILSRYCGRSVMRMDRGNHFNKTIERMAESIAWTLE